MYGDVHSDRLSRDRAGRHHARRVPRRARATPTRRSRATRRLRSACPAPWPGWRWRMRATARAGSRSAELIAPAIELARDGIPIEDDVADLLPRAQPRLARWPASAKIFLKADGSALGPGDQLVQRDLADTLAAIARDGPRAFYQGPIAEKHRRRGARGRRAHDARGSRALRADRARAGARQLSRPRHRLDAAVVVRRRGADRDAQHPGRLPGPRRPTTPAAAPDDRGDEARLCGPRALPRRSGDA